VQFVFDGEEIVLVVLSNEVDGETEMAETARASDSVQVGLGKLGKVEVDYDVN